MPSITLNLELLPMNTTSEVDMIILSIMFTFEMLSNHGILPIKCLSTQGPLLSSPSALLWTVKMPRGSSYN